MIGIGIVIAVIVAAVLLGTPLLIAGLMFLAKRKPKAILYAEPLSIAALPSAEPWEHRVAADLLDELARKKARSELLKKMQEAAATAEE